MRNPLSDAVANRERIVAAARGALAGSQRRGRGTQPAIGRQGRRSPQGTLYRHLPSREHLLAEVYRQEMGELAGAVPPLLVRYPPLDALTRWLDRLIECARVKRGVMAAIEVSARQDLYADNHGRLDEALTELLAQGKAAGEVRGDIDAADVILLLGALSRVPEAEWDARVRTLVAVIVDGLRRR